MAAGSLGGGRRALAAAQRLPWTPERSADRLFAFQRSRAGFGGAPGGACSAVQRTTRQRRAKTRLRKSSGGGKRASLCGALLFALQLARRVGSVPVRLPQLGFGALPGQTRLRVAQLAGALRQQLRMLQARVGARFFHSCHRGDAARPPCAPHALAVRGRQGGKHAVTAFGCRRICSSARNAAKRVLCRAPARVLCSSTEAGSAAEQEGVVSTDERCCTGQRHRGTVADGRTRPRNCSKRWRAAAGHAQERGHQAAVVY